MSYQQVDDIFKKKLGHGAGASYGFLGTHCSVFERGRSHDGLVQKGGVPGR